MKLLPFEINRKIEFLFKDGGSGFSLVQDCRKGYILITIPLDGYKTRLLNVGEFVTGIYYGPEENIYMFHSKVLSRLVQNIPLYKLSMPDSFEKVQRRDFVRVPVRIPVLYMENPSKSDCEGMTVAEIKKAYSAALVKGTVLDISGGGMNISTAKPLDIDNQVLVLFPIDDMHIAVWGKVVRCRTEIINNIILYRLGVKYTDISESDREKIIGFVFTKLREMRQKGVL